MGMTRYKKTDMAIQLHKRIMKDDVTDRNLKSGYAKVNVAEALILKVLNHSMTFME